MLINMQKCGVIGCGFVGSATSYTLAMNGIFSEIILIDQDHNKAIGEAMDIIQGMPFANPNKIYAGDYCDLKECGIVIIAAGANQKEGETRLDLVDKNIKIFNQIIPKIVAVNRECILLVLSNPVDILTYISMQISGFSFGQVLGSGTVLDTARFKCLLGEHLGVDMRNIHAFIIGEHGDSELAVWSSANVSGIDLDEYCNICGKCNNKSNMMDIYHQVKNSAYKIIESKGATYYAIAMSAYRICKAIVRNEHSVLTVSAFVNGHYGINDVCLGVPCIVGAGGVEKVLDIPLSKNEKDNLFNSADALKKILKQYKKQAE